MAGNHPGPAFGTADLTNCDRELIQLPGSVQPHGRLSLGPGDSYSFTVFLQASRLGTDRDGRRYSIVIAAMDNAGNRAWNAAAVIVPHDRQH